MLLKKVFLFSYSYSFEFYKDIFYPQPIIILLFMHIVKPNQTKPKQTKQQTNWTYQFHYE